MPGAAELAHACPRVPFILQHAGMLTDTTPAAWAHWRENIAILANEPNVYAKLSGFGTFIHRNDATHIGQLIQATVSTFGPQRCLWGSNFPIEKIWTDYASLVAAHRRGVSELDLGLGEVTEATARSIFYETASRVYRL
jgi:predicted TIM-barrel fold metal-dependent hydrolase